MKSPLVAVGLAGVLFLSVSWVGVQPVSALNINSLGTPITQNFDGLPASGSATWVNDSTVPGWYHARTGTGTTIVANNGSSNAGNLYSYGTGTATDRALGSVGSGNAAIGNLFWGILLTNNTGSTITSLDVSYTGEQWRNSAAAAQTASFSYLTGMGLTGSLAEFQMAGTGVAALDFTSPITGGSAGALDGNLAANRTAISSTISGLVLANGQQIMLRWSDPDHTGADHGLAIDDFSVTANGGVVLPTLNIGDVTQAEGDSGTTTFNFMVTLTSPAGAGGVSFTVNTADGTTSPANAGSDYVAVVNGSGSISQGNSSTTVAVTVNGDMTTEPNETFFVNITDITGANAGDVQGLGTINNDDVTLTPIHDIQGPGASSPLSGSVSTRGVVTGVKTNGFFIQEPDATVDADPATSEGIFVFTGSAPPAAAMVGNLVQVTGTISEFVPSADPLQPPLTELTSPTVVQLSTGNPLPVPIALTATFPDPAGPFDQLERLEGMRVSVSSFTVVGPTDGNVSEPNATSTSNGVFFGTVTGVARPFREPGIQAPDPPPSGMIPPIPRFDTNPERLRVDSDAQPGSLTVDVATGQLITGMVGPLDYSFRAYSILPDAASPPIVTGSLSATPVPIPAPNQFTVASFNLERFFDTVNDPAIGDVVLTATAFANRLNKASLAIRNVLRAPDILGVVEMENLSTLQALAAKINSDAIDAGGDDPNYQAYLVEGNDVGGIDVGFLVKSPRVNVVSVTQEGKDFTWIDPDDNQPALLNDRPPLVLEATIDGFAITVIVNHLRSFLGIESNAPDGLTTEGNRVRQKRKAQAEFLANLVQMRQVADPSERIVLVGDFNAFQFNDGYVDVMGGIKGTPVPAGEAVLTITDLVNPDLIILVDSVTPSERYSYVFEGNAQVLDHILVTGNVSAQLFYARNDADFPETLRNDPNRPERISDHDIPVAYFDVACEVTCPANITVTSEPSQCGASVKFSTTETGCASVVCTPPSGSFFRAGTTTVTCAEDTAPTSPKDAAGVTPGSSCSFTVTVTDATAPTIACPSNIAVNTEPGQCSAVVNFTVAGNDDCPGVTIVSSPPSGSTFPKGTTTVTSTATDASGNTSSCSFTVTVNDNQPPAISCPTSITAIAGGSCAIVNYPVPIATDNCPSVSVSCTPPPGACLSPGTTTVTCVATDAGGNTATCSFAVTTFDVCVQDDATASKVALVNSLTGDYRFCCAGTTYTGRGTVSVRGNSVTLEHNGPTRRVLIKVDKGLKSGTASIQSPPGSIACTIRDTNTANNQCACQ